jgi:hypothetical protein
MVVGVGPPLFWNKAEEHKVFGPDIL